MPELPGVPAGDGGCAQACADRKVGGCGAGENGWGEGAATVSEIARALRPKPLKSAPAGPVCQFQERQRPSGPRVLCKSGAYRASCLARALFRCYGFTPCR